MGDSCGSSSSSLFDVGFRESLFQSLIYNDLPRLKQLLSTLDLRASLDIVNLFDNNGLTLLHRAVSINSMEFTRYIIRFIKRQLVQFYKAKKIIREKQKLKFTKDENIEGSRAQIVKEANEKAKLGMQKVNKRKKDDPAAWGEETYTPRKRRSHPIVRKIVGRVLRYIVRA